jgi:hypothetical protein
MTPPHSNEVLLDSEASLRLVDRALTDLGVSRVGADGEAGEAIAHDASPAVLELVSLLPRVHAEISDVIRNLRLSRDALRRAGLDRLHQPNERPHEVFEATEVAATEMLARLDRALAMVEALEAAEEKSSGGPAATIRSGLRGELTHAIDRLRLQDFTSRQLQSASNALTEMEERLSLLARIFDPERLRRG